MLAGTVNIASATSGCAESCSWMTRRYIALLLLFGLDSDRLEVFGFEDLPAIEALHVVHAVSTGEDNCFLMLAGGLHNQRLRYELL
jgi:hypothetical protein